MGTEEGTHDMTWEDIEEKADKLRVKGGRKGGKTAQILARAGALVSGAPPDASGQPTNKAAMDWTIMGAEEGTRDMTWEQIEEGAAKLRGKGGAIFKTAASRSAKVREASEQPRQTRPHGWWWRKMTVIPMRASCPSVDCFAPLNAGRRRRRALRPSVPYATRAGSPKNRYTVAKSTCVANVTARPHSARRRFVPISLAQDCRNVASIFTSRKKMYRKMHRMP